MSTVWDAELAYLLTPALAAYENERVTGNPYGNPEFQQAVRGAVPKGHTFKGFPVLFNHRDPQRMFDSVFRRTDVAVDILRARGDGVRFALRCRVYPYPEDTYAVWVMLAVKYEPLR